MKHWLSENLGFKIVALVVAVVVWFGVKADREAEVRYPVPVEVVTEGDDEVILGGVPRTVDVTFTGTGRELLRLGDQKYRVRRTVEPGQPGPRRIRLAPADVVDSGNLSVRAIAVEPSLLTLSVDRVVSKRVPLIPFGEPRTEEGYTVAGPVRFDPASVTLVGARSILASIDTLPVDLRSLTGDSDGLNRTLRLRIPEHPTVVVQPDSVRILAQIVEASAGAPDAGGGT